MAETTVGGPVQCTNEQQAEPAQKNDINRWRKHECIAVVPKGTYICCSSSRYESSLCQRVTDICKHLHLPWIEELQEELGDGFYLGFVGDWWPLWWHAASKAQCVDTMEIGFSESSIAYSFV